MPGESRSRNPAGVEIVFTESDHRYCSVIDGREVEYVSGTSLVGRYFKPFDADKFAPLTARKLHVTAEEVKRMWAEKGEQAARFGTRCHEVCEDVLLGRPVRNTPENPREDSTFKFTVPFVEGVARKFAGIEPEKVVFDPRLRVAGTIDVFARSRDQDNLFYIFDWKTNERLDRENKYGDLMLGPVAHLQDTAYNHYLLQLNLYEYLLRFGGYVPHDAIFKKAIFWIGPRKPEVIQIPDAQTEVRDILIDFLASSR